MRGSGGRPRPCGTLCYGGDEHPERAPWSRASASWGDAAQLADPERGEPVDLADNHRSVLRNELVQVVDGMQVPRDRRLVRREAEPREGFRVGDARAERGQPVGDLLGRAAGGVLGRGVEATGAGCGASGSTLGG